MSTFYLSPGPSALPEPVRSRVKSELLDTFGIGVSILEISHRSRQYEALNDETHVLARRILGVPDTHSLLFTPFGAQHHFCLLLNHLTVPGDTVLYMDTGVWAQAALNEAKLMGRDLQIAFQGAPDFTALGTPQDWNLVSHASYLHITVNNTVEGTEYATIPRGLGIPLILDMTSSLAARQDIPWEDAAVVYASAQKNFGIAGLSIVIVRNDVLEKSRDLAIKNNVGRAMSYGPIFDAKSALNTPPVFALFVTNRMLQWMEALGGVATMEEWSRQRADQVYGQIDAGFYVGRADPSCRSRHNFVFRLPTPEWDEQFIREARSQGILEIKGYRTTGGVRASMYNGAPQEAGLVFADFMQNFRTKFG